MNINPSIFKAYDIRGIWEKDLNKEIAYLIGRSFVSYIQENKIIVGRDMRIGSPELHESLICGINEQGADVVNIGLVSTEQFYFACGSMKLPGIIVTASHNPKEYNGFKIVKHMPLVLSEGNGMEILRRMVIDGSYKKPSRKGDILNINIYEEYRRKILSLVDVDKIKDMKVVIDAANGMGGLAFDLIYKNINIKTIKMYFDPDGRFPNHGGDPLQEENRRELQERVIRENADLGFAFDPDCDRFFVINHNGFFVPGDFITALFGQYFVQKYGGEIVIYDTRASWAIRDLVKAAGGEVVETRIGHAFIKAKMQEFNAVFAGEITGHYYFREYYCAESAILPSLMLLEMLANYGKSLSELLEPLLQKYFLSGEINSTVVDPDSIIAEIKRRYGNDNEIYTLDGISVVSKDWHANIRKSNTESLIRLNVEGLSQNIMEEKRDELLQIIRS